MTGQEASAECVECGCSLGRAYNPPIRCDGCCTAQRYEIEIARLRSTLEKAEAECARLLREIDAVNRVRVDEAECAIKWEKRCDGKGAVMTTITTGTRFHLVFHYADGTSTKDGSWLVPHDSDYSTMQLVEESVGNAIVYELAKQPTKMVVRVEILPGRAVGGEL